MSRELFLRGAATSAYRNFRKSSTFCFLSFVCVVVVSFFQKRVCLKPLWICIFLEMERTQRPRKKNWMWCDVSLLLSSPSSILSLYSSIHSLFSHSLMERYFSTFWGSTRGEETRESNSKKKEEKNNIFVKEILTTFLRIQVFSLSLSFTHSTHLCSRIELSIFCYIFKRNFDESFKIDDMFLGWSNVDVPKSDRKR